MTDHLFETPPRGGYFVIAKPAGFEWGPGELDPDVFVIVRAESLPAPEADLRARLQALAAVSGPLGGNGYSAGEFRNCPPEEWAEQGEG